jgi:hypothetical protein
LRLTEDLGARRLPPPATEPVPDPREDHDAFSDFQNLRHVALTPLRA